MPEFEPKEEPFKIVINFLNEKDRDKYVQENKLKFLAKKEGGRTWSANYPFKERQDLNALSYE